MSAARVNGPNIWGHFSKSRRNWFFLFAFWGMCGAAALTAVWGKTHRHWFGDKVRNIDGAYALKMLNFNMPDSYRDFAEALAQGKAVPENYTTYFELTVQYMPDDFAGHYLLALCRQSKGEWEKAAQSYRAALDHNPYFFWGYYNLGALYAATGHAQEARAVFAAALKVPPEFTMKSLGSSKLMVDVIRDPVFAGHDAAATLRLAYQAVEAYTVQVPERWGLPPVIF